MAESPEEFARRLEAAIPKVAKQTVAVVRKGSLNVKNEAKRNVLQTAPVRNAHAHQAINFDVDAPGGGVVVGEIGYDKTDKRGRIGNLLEFGGGGDHSPPHRDLARALESEEPRFVRALEDMIKDVLD